jgi:hypothetical protein
VLCFAGHPKPADFVRFQRIKGIQVKGCAQEDGTRLQGQAALLGAEAAVSVFLHVEHNVCLAVQFVVLYSLKRESARHVLEAAP